MTSSRKQSDTMFVYDHKRRVVVWKGRNGAMVYVEVLDALWSGFWEDNLTGAAQGQFATASQTASHGDIITHFPAPRPVISLSNGITIPGKPHHRNDVPESVDGVEQKGDRGVVLPDSLGHRPGTAYVFSQRQV